MQSGKGLIHVLPAHRTFDTGYWMLPTLGSNVVRQQACECNAGHRFFGRLGRTESTTGKARTRRGQNGDVTGEQDLRRIPGSSVVPRVALHISRVSGPGHHQLSVIGCAIVTVSSIAVTL